MSALLKILEYLKPSTVPVGTTGLAVEDQVLVLNSLETEKHMSGCGGACPGLPAGSTHQAAP